MKAEQAGLPATIFSGAEERTGCAAIAAVPRSMLIL
jgi:hypothetical protein